jgi:hypothetical protein
MAKVNEEPFLTLVCDVRLAMIATQPNGVYRSDAILRLVRVTTVTQVYD